MEKSVLAKVCVLDARRKMEVLGKVTKKQIVAENGRVEEKTLREELDGERGEENPAKEIYQKSKRKPS